MTNPIAVIGGGIAGLAAAVTAAEAGADVTLFESSRTLGGRCKSHDDAILGCSVDNGSHLILSANPILLHLLGPDHLEKGSPAIPFFDAKSGEHWTLRPNYGPLPWWLLLSARRPPGVKSWELLSLARLLTARKSQTVADILPKRPENAAFFERLLIPLCKAILNAPPDQASAFLLANTLKLTLGKGAAFCTPFFAPRGLTPDLIDPLCAKARALGVRIETTARITRLEDLPTTATPPHPARPTRQGTTLLRPAASRVIFALPPRHTAQILAASTDRQVCSLAAELPELSHQAISAIHFRIRQNLPPGYPPMMGIAQSPAEWVFARPCSDGALLSVTQSAATPLHPQELTALWHHSCRALGLNSAVNPLAHRVFHHKQATLSQDPVTLALLHGWIDRVRAPLGQRGLWLAGDWTDTALPNTLEAAARSGVLAAKAALGA